MNDAVHRGAALLLTRRFVADYVRNPVNLTVLAIVPVVFVMVAAGTLADSLQLLGGRIGPAVETATAGWAAGFLSSLAMYFQIRSARAADRRLLVAGLPSSRLVAARAATGLLLAGLVSVVSLIALAIRTGIDQPGRVILGTLMFAVIYLAIGALIGLAVGNPVNGAVVILFIWFIDVFLGPAGSGADRVFTRWFPTHFVTLWMVDLPSRHGGRLGDLGLALVWVFGAVMAAGVVLGAGSRTAATTRRASGRFGTAVRFGLLDLRRNPVLLVLLVLVPVAFILLAWATTPARDIIMVVSEGGASRPTPFWFPDVHAGAMTPIAIGSLATLAGMFVVLDAASGDRRLHLAGYPAWVVIAARLTVSAAAIVVICMAALSVTATLFHAREWAAFAAVNFAIALTYGLVGVIIGPLFGRVAGVFIAFLIPFLDLAMFQSPMLRPEPEAAAKLLPGYGWTRVLFDVGLTDHFDETGPLLFGLAWLAALLGLAVFVLMRRIR